VLVLIPAVFTLVLLALPLREARWLADRGPTAAIDVSDGLVAGSTPSGEPWAQRVSKWLAEQQVGRRIVLLAQGAPGLLGMLQLVLKFPTGYQYADAAHALALLSARSKWPRRRTANNCKEPSSPPELAQARGQQPYHIAQEPLCVTAKPAT